MKKLKSENWECTEVLKQPFRQSIDEVVDKYLSNIREDLIEILSAYEEVEIVVNYTGRDEE